MSTTAPFVCEKAEAIFWLEGAPNDPAYGSLSVSENGEATGYLICLPDSFQEILIAPSRIGRYSQRLSGIWGRLTKTDLIFYLFESVLVSSGTLWLAAENYGLLNESGLNLPKDDVEAFAKEFSKWRNELAHKATIFGLTSEETFADDLWQIFSVTRMAYFTLILKAIDVPIAQVKDILAYPCNGEFASELYSMRRCPSPFTRIFLFLPEQAIQKLAKLEHALQNNCQPLDQKDQKSLQEYKVKLIAIRDRKDTHSVALPRLPAAYWKLAAPPQEAIPNETKAPYLEILPRLSFWPEEKPPQE